MAKQRERLLIEAEARQKNTAPPDILRNGALVDSLLWKGRPHPTMVQRIGIALLGLVYMGPGIMLVGVGYFEPRLYRLLYVLLAMPFFIFGGKALYNACRR